MDRALFAEFMRTVSGLFTIFAVLLVLCLALLSRGLGGNLGTKPAHDKRKAQIGRAHELHANVAALKSELASMKSALASVKENSRLGEESLASFLAVQEHYLSWEVACGVRDDELAAACEAPGVVQLWGERHTGSTMIQYILFKNFLKNMEVKGHGQPFPYGFKHMFSAHKEAHWSAHWKAKLMQPLDDGALTLLAVREPIQWLISLHKLPYHNQPMSRLSFDDFVRSPWDATGNHAEHFANVVEMRTRKMQLLRDAAMAARQNRTLGRVMSIREEDTKRDQLKVVCALAQTRQLCPNGPTMWLQQCKGAAGSCREDNFRKASSFTASNAPVRYEGNVTALFNDPRTLRWVLREIDWVLEGFFGYAPPIGLTPETHAGSR